MKNIRCNLSARSTILKAGGGANVGPMAGSGGASVGPMDWWQVVGSGGQGDCCRWWGSGRQWAGNGRQWAGSGQAVGAAALSRLHQCQHQPPNPTIDRQSTGNRRQSRRNRPRSTTPAPPDASPTPTPNSSRSLTTSYKIYIF